MLRKVYELCNIFLGVGLLYFCKNSINFLNFHKILYDCFGGEKTVQWILIEIICIFRLKHLYWQLKLGRLGL